MTVPHALARSPARVLQVSEKTLPVPHKVAAVPYRHTDIHLDLKWTTGLWTGANDTVLCYMCYTGQPWLLLGR